MNPTDALLEHRGIPRQIHVDHGRSGVLKIEPDSARVSRQKYPAFGVLVKLLHQCATLGSRYAAVKQYVVPLALIETAHNQFVRAYPLTEHHNLGVRSLKCLFEQRHQFVRLGAIVRLAIQQKAAVAGHPHVLQRTGERALIGV